MSMRKQSLETKARVDEGLDALRVALDKYVEQRMKSRFGSNWRHHAWRPRGSSMNQALDVYSLLKTLLDHWPNLFSSDSKLRKVRSYISISLDGRNRTAHFSGHMPSRAAIRYLDAMRLVADSVGGRLQSKAIEELYNEQLAGSGDQELEERTDPSLKEPPTPDYVSAWRDVCEPHPDVLSARISDAEFAANLALVDQGEGSEEYVDPSAFFRITYLTEGLKRVLLTTIQTLSGVGGNPVVGLQTNFGGGKTHALLALHHLAGARTEGYNPKDLYGMRPLFKEADVESLGRVKRAVFVGTHKGVAEPMHIEDGRTIRTLWGYIAWRLGGWEAVNQIAGSESARTNPGSEALIPILRSAAPCIILLDEVVAFARQLRGHEYDSFHAFIQSLTEAVAAVERAVVVGSLPESDMEVGDSQGRDALDRLAKIFGRVQSAWIPATGIETYEIVRRRLFQPLDKSGESLRDKTISSYRKMYRDHPEDFPLEVRQKDYELEMRSAYPLHPEILRRFSGDWSVLERFQRTRGILKIMADVVYLLWRSQSNAPLIMPGMLPFDDAKVRSSLLEPLDSAFGPILQSEIEGSQSHTARLEAQRPRFLKTRAPTRVARAVFFATAPHAGSSGGSISGSDLRLSCACPDDQPAIFKEAIEELASRAAYLYRDGENYWFSPQPTLNKLAADRAREVSDEEADNHIKGQLRNERRTRSGFPRVHAAPDHLSDIDDLRSTALVVLPPAAHHDPDAGEESLAVTAAKEVLRFRGSSQRIYRNSLIFVAADQRKLDTVRRNARKALGWQSIVGDADLQNRLTNAQTKDAWSRVEQCQATLQHSIRATWVYVLHLEPSEADGNGKNATSPYVMKCTRIVNRGAARTISEAVWQRLQRDGFVVSSMGPQNLSRALKAVWHEDQPHVSIETLLNWFASYPHMPRFKDETSLCQAIQGLVADFVVPIAFASGFDEARGSYIGATWDREFSERDLRGGLLVRRELVSQLDDDADKEGDADSEVPDEDIADPKQNLSTRFFASIPLNPEKAGVEVARIMDAILVELTRSQGDKIELTLEIQGAASDQGYSNNVREIVRDNVRDLKLDGYKLGFEGCDKSQ